MDPVTKGGMLKMMMMLAVVVVKIRYMPFSYNMGSALKHWNLHTILQLDANLKISLYNQAKFLIQEIIDKEGITINLKRRDS